MRRACFSLVLASVLASASAAGADDPAAAQALFDEAKRLTAAGRLSEACPKFLASLKLDPKPGAAVNLADCYEKSGKLASAWARYIEAATLAERLQQTARQQYAKDHAAKLEGRLSRLTIVVANAPEGLEIARDGEAVDPAVWGSAVPVDPGQHVVEARAPGKSPWTTHVDVGGGAARVTVAVPALADAQSSPPPLPSSRTPPPSGLGAQRIAGITIAGIGVAGVIVGAAFGGVALSKWSGLLHDDCQNSPTNCDATGLTRASAAKQAATASDVGFIAGGALVATGLVVIFTSPRRSSPEASRETWWLAPDVASSRAGLSAGGSF